MGWCADGWRCAPVRAAAGLDAYRYDMMLAFLIDQVQQRCCRLFQAAKAKVQRALYFWSQLRRLFLKFEAPDWQTLYRAIAFGHRSRLELYDTS